MRYHLAAGSYAAGNQFADQLLKLNNLGERANRYKMLLLARSGWRNVALQQYERYRDLLAEELGVEPAAETTAVYHRIQSAQTTLPHNLPPSATPFVGAQPGIGRLPTAVDQPRLPFIDVVGAGRYGQNAADAGNSRAHCAAAARPLFEWHSLHSPGCHPDA
ncbi:MAG: bacterial transcriptional activator domain-containing protein [Chloroflexi bacterium]|nr:bacterial transcriptional activator domain-containing protein [Chloroflexota bacterium]